MNNMTESERAKYLIDHLCGGSSVKFADSIGIDKTRLSKIIHGRLRLSRLYDIILATYPNVNQEWLRTGEGYPGDLSIVDVKARYEAIITEKDELIKSLRRVIEEKL